MGHASAGLPDWYSKPAAVRTVPLFVSDVSWIPRIGDEFAGYRLVSLIGHGGMSIVYRAEHIGLERTVALKLLSPR